VRRTPFGEPRAQVRGGVGVGGGPKTRDGGVIKTNKAGGARRIISYLSFSLSLGRSVLSVLSVSPGNNNIIRITCVRRRDAGDVFRTLACACAKCVTYGLNDDELMEFTRGRLCACIIITSTGKRARQRGERERERERRKGYVHTLLDARACINHNRIKRDKAD